MGAGDSATSEAERLREQEQRLRERADALARRAERYDFGGAGERRLAELLVAVSSEGFVLLPDRCVPGTESNIDMLAVGPPGVFVLDAKRWSGELGVKDGVVVQDGRRRPSAIDGLVGQATVVYQLLAEAARSSGLASPPPVFAALCFVGSGSIGPMSTAGHVSLVDGGDVTRFVLSPKPVLTPGEVERIAGLLAATLAARTEVRENSADNLTAIAPAEPLVFLVPWRGWGHRRIYVKDENGVDGGYLDLRSGELAETTEQSEAVLRRLLPRYLDSGGDADDVDRGVIRRFLDSFRAPARQVGPALITATLWRNHGRKRLYVSHLAPDGAATDIGWIDLRESRVHADLDGWAPVIRYCGDRFCRSHPDIASGS